MGILFIVSPTILKVLLLSDGGDLKVGRGTLDYRQGCSFQTEWEKPDNLYRRDAFAL